MSKTKKSYLNMNKAELAEATADLGAGAVPPGEPLTPEEQARWDRAAGGRDGERPRRARSPQGG
jgi:hypothetical protein